LEEKISHPNFSLTKLLKIRKSFEYQTLNRLKKRIYGKYIAVDYRLNTNLNNPRLGITVPSKMANAYIRNKFKRLIREIFRLNQNTFPKHLEINVLAKSLKDDLHYTEIEKDFLNLISTIKK